MVGETLVVLTRASRSWLQKLLALKRFFITTVPPTSRKGRVLNMSPLVWKSGITHIVRSPAFISNALLT
jgi:hypothetical protein